MTESDFIDLTRQGVWVLIKIGGPLMVATLVVGLVISLLQALTQIQETTLSFVPKLLVVFFGLVLFLPFMLQTLETFTHQLADRIVAVGSSPQ